MNYSEDFVKSINQRIKEGKHSDILDTVDFLKPIQYFNEHLGKVDYSFDPVELRKFYSTFLVRVGQGDEMGICMMPIIPLLVKEIQELKKLLNVDIKPREDLDIEEEEEEVEQYEGEVEETSIDEVIKSNIEEVILDVIKPEIVEVQNIKLDFTPIFKK